MSNVFAKYFNLKIPLVQAPIAGISSPNFAAAVCNAGTIGSLGLGAMILDQAEKICQS